MHYDGVLIYDLCDRRCIFALCSLMKVSDCSRIVISHSLESAARYDCCFLSFVDEDLYQDFMACNLFDSYK